MEKDNWTADLALHSIHSFIMIVVVVVMVTDDPRVTLTAPTTRIAITSGSSPAADEGEERLILRVLMYHAQQHHVARKQLQQLLRYRRHARDETAARIERHHTYPEPLALTELDGAHRLRM